MFYVLLYVNGCPPSSGLAWPVRARAGMYASAAAPGRVRRKSGLEDPRPETQERRAKGGRLPGSAYEGLSMVADH